MSKSYRKYQQEADDAITKCLLEEDKCLVKMFCGTGKSLVMRNVGAIKGKKMVAWVFPTIALSTQFHDEYLEDVSPESILMVSSSDESDASTDPEKIKKFLKRKSCKYICVTYQSFGLFVDCLGSTKIDLCMFDEAHHVCGSESQKLIFEENHCLKQVFFTATPKNANGIVMYDCENVGMCGPLVCEYSYLDGKCAGVLNGFDIHIDMYTENTNKSIYESIVRAILTTGNNRVLTFHSDVNTERDTSVLQFVDESLFQEAFQNVLEEFPEKVGFYQSIKMLAMTSSIPNSERTRILAEFDASPNNEIFVISSCETIGEGIDTKRANMCVFVDPKSSFVKIIQNIGRIVRKPEGVVNNATILIPCWVDREKYLECEGDPEKVDEVIRSEMNAGGNFNGILNVLSALKQEDEDLFDACLRYPDVFSPQEISRNLKRQGLEELESVGTLEENLSHVIGKEVEFDEESDEENIERIAKENKVCVEIHTNSLETPIERYNPEAKKIVRLMKTEGEEGDEYCPIVKKNPKAKDVPTEPPSRNRNKIEVHTNPDIRVLWNFVGIDLSKRFCSCVIDCEVIDLWFERLEESDRFIRNNGKVPSNSSKDKKEKSLGTWITNQKQNIKHERGSMLIFEKKERFLVFLERYKKYFIDNKTKWFTRLSETKEYIFKNNNLPKIKKKCSVDDNLGLWVSRNKKNFKNKTQCMQDNDIHDAWKDFVECYKKYFILPNEKWENDMKLLEIFIDNNLRRPRQICDDPNESHLGIWLGNQVQNYKNKRDSMKEPLNRETWAKFLENYKDYLTDDTEKWESLFIKLKIFICKNKRRPNKRSDSLVEKQLGQWFTNNLEYYKKKIHKLAIPERYNRFMAFLEENKEYFIDDDDKWNDNFEELKMYIDKNNKRPNKRSVHENEKRLGYWLTNQLGHYRKKNSGMKDETRYNIWTEFMKEYSHIFDDLSETASESGSVEDEIIKIPKKSMKLSANKLTKQESPEQKRQRVKREISELHQKYKTMRSDNLASHFAENPEDWHHYHAISEKNEESFPEEEIPRNRIIRELALVKTGRPKVVVDCGCGRAQIAQHFAGDKRFIFYNYDHVASHPSVISHDISRLPHEDMTVDFVILSLAMWGSNCREYIAEARRVLDGGFLYIIEPTKRWTDNEPVDRLRHLLKENGFQIVEESVEKFCFFKCL